MHKYHEWRFRRARDDDRSGVKSSNDAAGIDGPGSLFRAVHDLRVGGDSGTSLAGAHFFGVLRGTGQLRVSEHSSGTVREGPLSMAEESYDPWPNAGLAV